MKIHKQLRYGRDLFSSRVGFFGLVFAVVGGFLIYGAFAAPSSPSTPQTQASNSVPLHIETWAYDDSTDGRFCNGGYNPNATTGQALVRQWVTYAETNCGPNASKANSDCHGSGGPYCTTLAYLDANWQWPNGGGTYSGVTGAAPTSPNDAWFLHFRGTCTNSPDASSGNCTPSNRLTCNDPSYGAGLYTNQNNLALDQWFRDDARANFSNWDGLFMDDTGIATNGQIYCSAANQNYQAQELPTTADSVAAHQLMANTLTRSNGTPFFQVNNGISPNPYLTKPWPLLNSPNQVHGFLSEGSPWSRGFQSWYSNLLDDLAYIGNNYPSGYFQALLSYDDNGPLQARRVQAATILLGYSPGHVVSWENLEQNNLNLSVWPEQGIYPTNPVQTMGNPSGSVPYYGACMNGTGGVCTVGGHNDLEVATGTAPPGSRADHDPGVYRREFGTCYNLGVAFGPCAAIVNDTNATVTIQASWLSRSYSHQITFAGGDVQSGGAIDPSGANFIAGSTTIAPGDAMLISAPTASGDINGDGHVNITDLSLLLSSYGSGSPTCTTNPADTCDLSGDGAVGIVDLSILLSHYGT